MNIRRLAGLAAAALLLAFAGPAVAGDTILAGNGKVTGGEEVRNSLSYARSVWQIGIE